MTGVISEDRAIELIAACGANPARWPADARAALEQWAGASARVRAALDEAREIDAALANWTTPEPSPGARAAILAAAAGSGLAAGGASPVQRRWFYPAGAIAAAIGLALLGTSYLRPAPTPALDAPVQVAEAEALSMVYSTSVSLDDGEWRL